MRSLALLVFVSALAAQSHTVVPAAAATSDAVSMMWLPGCAASLRQQTLVGPTRLPGRNGQTLQAIEFRRQGTNEAYVGGAVQWMVRVANAPVTPLSASRAFATNLGGAPTTVFQGVLTVPSSPAVTGTTVDWTSNNVVRVPFTTPFVYTGGTLCLDILGHAVSGQRVTWWPADCEFEDVAGTVVDLGAGCHASGAPASETNRIMARTLLRGGQAQFFARGTAGDLALLMHGTPAAMPVPLVALGLPAHPACRSYLDPAGIAAVTLSLFVTEPGVLGGGYCEQFLPLPNEPWILGASMASQWAGVPSWTVTNGVQWTVGTAIPTLDMAHIEGNANDVDGVVAVHQAHVIRFEFQ
jgi:hypothetical protein